MTRKSNYSINEIFPNRWSKRAMSGEELKEKELMSLFEAARWAPSSFNSQPWRFVYAVKGTERFKEFLDLLVDFNKSWVKNSGALVIVLSKKTFDENFSKTHSFDTGAAWENLALQASISNIVCHGMGGFNHEKAKEILNISDDYNVEMMIALGKSGKKEDLPEELQKMEEPNTRKEINKIAFQDNLILDEQACGES